MTSKLQPAAIIVGVDGSDASIAALREAVSLAVRLGAPVQALTCWSLPSVYVDPYTRGLPDFKGAAQHILDRSVERAFGVNWPANLTTRVEQGPPRQTLIAASRDVAFLVLGRRGFGGFAGLLLGSVSSACISHAHCPVLIVHAPPTGEPHE